MTGSLKAALLAAIIELTHEMASTTDIPQLASLMAQGNAMFAQLNRIGGLYPDEVA